MQVADVGKMIQLLEDYMEEYNLSNPSTLNLVFFMDAVEHITRVARVLRQPRGNALLVGVGGSGNHWGAKQVHSVCRCCLHTHICMEVVIHIA
jgi:dynein heavy chain, axonemal